MSKTVLEAKNISVTLNDIHILHDISMHLEEGEFLGIIGPNGAGKSTLLKAIRGIVSATYKEITLLGRPLESMTEKEIARELAYMQQDVHIGFGFTAEEIVLSARYPYLAWWENESEADKQIVEKCMKFTGVYELRDKVVNQLSGGERQRVLLAKVLAQETPIIFLDEPTASLDLVYQEEIFRYCKKLTETGKTIVMICHDLTMAARFCSRLMLIAKGKVYADGNPEQVLTAENIRDTFGLQSIVYRNPVSGHLDIYSYEKETLPLERCKPALICGSSVELGKIIRELYALNVPMRMGAVPQDSVAAYCADVFGIPYISNEGTANEKTQRNCVEESVAFCYGLQSRDEWEQRQKELNHATRVYYSSAEVFPYCTQEEKNSLVSSEMKHKWIDMPLSMAVAHEYIKGMAMDNE